MKQFLKDEISRGNTTNLGRSLPEAMANDIIAATDFLENPKNFNERVYCIINDISRQPKDVYGKNARFININLGYSYKISSAVDELRLALDSLKKRRKNLDRQMVKALSDSSLRKVIEFKNRNLKKNCHLYDKNAVEGEDYVVCPITNMRKAMIESKYIVNVLGMTVEEFDELYPNIQKVSQRRMTNIKNGLKEIDPITGLPKYKIGMLKSKQTLSRVGPDGKTGYKRKGEKTRNTHMSKIDEYGNNGYSQLAKKAIVKGNLTKAKNGLILDPTNRSDFYRYKAIVSYLTNKNRKKLTKGYVTGLAGNKNAHHIDHKFSIKEGFENKISPIHIGSNKNMEMKSWELNLRKHTKSDISAESLLKSLNVTQEETENDFNLIMNLIREDIVNNIPVTAKRILDKFYEARSKK